MSETYERRDDDEAARRAELAHDLKTPIHIIVAYAELLRMRDDEQTRLAASGAILAAAKRLTGLVDELLRQESSPESGRLSGPRK